MIITEGTPGARMSSVGHILEEISQAQDVLQAGDEHTNAAANQSQTFAAVAIHVGDLLHQASAALSSDYAVDEQLVMNDGTGTDHYSTAAGILLSMALESGNPHIGAAAEGASLAVEAVTGHENGERAVLVIAAMRDAANKVIEAERAVAEAIGLAGKIALELHTGRTASHGAQQELQAYQEEIG
jgi:hypothetical protein